MFYWFVLANCTDKGNKTWKNHLTSEILCNESVKVGESVWIKHRSHCSEFWTELTEKETERDKIYDIMNMEYLKAMEGT